MIYEWGSWIDDTATSWTVTTTGGDTTKWTLPPRLYGYDPAYGTAGPAMIYGFDLARPDPPPAPPREEPPPLTTERRVRLR